MRALPRPRHMIENPLELGAREISVDDQARPCRDVRRVTGGLELVAVRGGAAVLPDNRVRDRPTRRALPDDGSLALIGYSDRRNVGCADAGLGERLVHDA